MKFALVALLQSQLYRLQIRAAHLSIIGSRLDLLETGSGIFDLAKYVRADCSRVYRFGKARTSVYLAQMHFIGPELYEEPSFSDGYEREHAGSLGHVMLGCSTDHSHSP